MVFGLHRIYNFWNFWILVLPWSLTHNCTFLLMESIRHNPCVVTHKILAHLDSILQLVCFSNQKMTNVQYRIFTSEIDMIEWDWNKLKPHLLINNCYNSCTYVSIWVDPIDKSSRKDCWEKFFFLSISADISDYRF